MLISKSKNYDAGDVVTFKLINGDEIIAKIVEVTDEGFSIERPQTIMPSAKGVGLIPSLFTADEGKSLLAREHVIMHGNTVKEMKTHYLQTTTGLSLVI
jgi:hypothetical protein